MKTINKSFKVIEGYVDYFVNRKGQIVSIRTGTAKIMKQPVNNAGYKYVCVRDSKGRQRTLLVHQVVTKTFKKRPKNAECIHHKDNDKLNNNSKNLVWSTFKKNTQAAVKDGCFAKTKNRNKVILICDDIEYIFHTKRQLAKFLGVSSQSIIDALNGKYKVKKHIIKYEDK